LSGSRDDRAVPISVAHQLESGAKELLHRLDGRLVRGFVVPDVERAWVANGEGGQRLFVLPGLNLAVAITAGNYLAEDQWIPPTRVMREVVLGSIV
jgi:hypothetical protein